jgi:hypothetical protein
MREVHDLVLEVLITFENLRGINKYSIKRYNGKDTIRDPWGMALLPTVSTVKCNFISSPKQSGPSPTTH